MFKSVKEVGGWIDYDAEVVERMLAYLEKFHNKNSTSGEREWVPRRQIRQAAARANIPQRKVEPALERLRDIANVGSRYDREVKDFVYRYYDRKKGDDEMQRAIDEF